MSFATITRFSLEILTQNYRAPGVAPGPVPPGRGDTSGPADPTFAVADEFIRVVPFINAMHSGQPVARQYQVGVAGPLVEPPFTARGGGSSWTTGAAFPFGQELGMSLARFKKIELVVRSDESMVAEMLNTQVRLARVALVRALSEAIFFSLPATDDDAELAGLPFFLGANSSQDVLYDNTSRKMIGGLSEIEARCSPSGGDVGQRPDVFVMSSRARWRLLKELEDKGVTPDFRVSRITRALQLHFHGIPVLVGRLPEPQGATPTCEAWALKLYGPSGVRVLHLGGQSAGFGIRSAAVNEVTPLDASGEIRGASRGVAVFGVYSILVPEPASIARLRGIPSADPFTTP